MRTGVRLLAVAAALLFPVVVLADVSPSCQTAVARGGAKFAKTALKIAQRCAIATGDATPCEPHAGGTTGNPRVQAGIARASARLAAAIGDGCARSDLSTFAGRCPDPTGPPLSVAELVACLRDTHLDRVAGLLAVEFPNVAPTPSQASGCATGQTCQCTCSPSGAFLEPTTDGLF